MSMRIILTKKQMQMLLKLRLYPVGGALKMKGKTLDYILSTDKGDSDEISSNLIVSL